MKNVGKAFDTQCVWIKQHPEVDIAGEEVSRLIITDYACFKTKCGKYFYGYLRDDGETFIDWESDKDVDYWKEWGKPEHPINVLGSNVSSIEESDNLDSWFILSIVSDSVHKPELEIEQNNLY